LRGIISQQLIPRADGTGRVLALETLTNTPAVSNVIREAKTFMLPGIIQTSRKQGMQLMDDALIELFSRDLITAEEALARAEQKEIVRQHLRRRRWHISINFCRPSSRKEHPIYILAKVSRRKCAGTAI